MHEGLHDSAPASHSRSVDPMKIFLAAMAAPPMTPEEKATFRSQIAAQMAEDDRRRQPEPQLPLEAAA